MGHFSTFIILDEYEKPVPMRGGEGFCRT